MRNLWGNILISTRYRYIIYHTNKKIRVKSAVFLAQRLNNNTPYFTNLRGRTAASPLPAPSAELTGLCATFLTRCRDVLLGRRRAYHPEDYTKWVTHNAAPVLPYSPDSQQPTYSAAPQTVAPLPEPSMVNTLPAAPLASVPATATTEPSPPQSTSSVSAFTQAIPCWRTLPLRSFQRPRIFQWIPLETLQHLWQSTQVPAYLPLVPLTPLPVKPHLTPRPITNTTKDRLLAPLILPPRPPPNTNLADIPVNRPASITNCYAGLFARLPSLFQIYGAPHHSAQALYNFIFAPSQPLEVPQPPDSTLPTTTTDLTTSDVSMGPAEAAHEPAAEPEPTPLGTLLDSFVDIPASLRDDHNHRTPTVLSSGLPDPVLGTTAPLVKLSSLLNYLNQHLTPHLHFHIGTSTQSCFVTLIIGPSTDVRVGAALHSHLVCAAVAPSNEDYSVLFIPSDLLTDFACPIEWQPLFLYLAASLAYPDLPFLVTTPDYMAGAICTAQGLRSLLNNSCSHILFATADTLVSPHLFLHLPPHVPLSQDAMDTGTASSSLHSFRFRTPEEVSLLVQSTFSDQLSHTAACRASVTEVDLQDAHFPLYCTPYYGYSPTTSVDLQVEILQLSNHLVSSLSLLSIKMEDDSLPTPSNLLSVLAAFYPHLLHVSPGEGLLLSPFTDPDNI